MGKGVCFCSKGLTLEQTRGWGEKNEGMGSKYLLGNVYSGF